MEFLIALLFLVLIIAYTLFCIAITTAIHELCHLACFKILGGKAQGLLDIKLFEIIYDETGWGLGGHVLARDGWKFPKCVKKFPRTACFLIGLSGGWGTATILSIIVLGLHWLWPASVLFAFCFPLALLAIVNFIYGIGEALAASKYPEATISKD